MDIKLKETKSIREAFGEKLKELATENPNIVGVSADIGANLKIDVIKEIDEKRYIEVGIAEQQMIALSAGLAHKGLLPICGSFAEFVPMRVLDQIRISVCMNNLHCIIIGSHAGLSFGGDGESVQCFEDIAALRSLPNIHIMIPANATEVKEMLELATTLESPVYIRLYRENRLDFELEKNVNLTNTLIYQNSGKENKNGKKISIVANGQYLYKAYEIAKELEKENIYVQVYNLSYIKPAPINFLNEITTNSNLIFSLEDHQITGGIGSLLSEYAAEYMPKQIIRFGVKDRFGECGTEEELEKELGLDNETLIEKIKSYIK